MKLSQNRVRANGATTAFFCDRLDGSKLLLNPSCQSEDSALDIILFYPSEGGLEATRLFGFGPADVLQGFKNYSDGFKEEALNTVETTVRQLEFVQFLNVKLG